MIFVQIFIYKVTDIIDVVLTLQRLESVTVTLSLTIVAICSNLL